MFESLQSKLESALKVFRGQSKITEENIKEALNEVRNALLDADVNFAVVKDFIEIKVFCVIMCVIDEPLFKE